MMSNKWCNQPEFWCLIGEGNKCPNFIGGTCSLYILQSVSKEIPSEGMKCITCDFTEFKKELCERCGKEIWICKRCFQTHFPKGVEDVILENGSHIVIGKNSEVSGLSTTHYTEPLPDASDCKFTCKFGHCHHPKHKTGVVITDDKRVVYPDCDGTRQITGDRREKDIVISDLSQRLHQCEEEKHKLMMKED